MQSNGTRIAALLVTLAVIVGLFFAFKGGGDDDSTTATDETTATTATGSGSEPAAGDKAKKEKDTVPFIDVVDGQPKGGVTDLEFVKGDEIKFAVRSNTADEVHVHGYDIEEEIEPGKPAIFDFPADLEGVFEVELHGSETQIAELTVNP
jgi:hypothetical protein